MLIINVKRFPNNTVSIGRPSFCFRMKRVVPANPKPAINAAIDRGVPGQEHFLSVLAMTDDKRVAAERREAVPHGGLEKFNKLGERYGDAWGLERTQHTTPASGRQPAGLTLWTNTGNAPTIVQHAAPQAFAILTVSASPRS